MQKKYILLNTLFLLLTMAASAGTLCLVGMFIDVEDFNYLSCALIYSVSFLIPSILVWMIAKLVFGKNSFNFSSHVISGFGVQYFIALAFKDYYNDSIYLEVMSYLAYFVIIIVAMLFLCWAYEKN